jgi:hypothetical protein
MAMPSWTADASLAVQSRRRAGGAWAAPSRGAAIVPQQVGTAAAFCSPCIKPFGFLPGVKVCCDLVPPNCRVETC